MVERCNPEWEGGNVRVGRGGSSRGSWLWRLRRFLDSEKQGVAGSGSGFPLSRERRGTGRERRSGGYDGVAGNGLNAIALAGGEGHSIVRLNCDFSDSGMYMRKSCEFHNPLNSGSDNWDDNRMTPGWGHVCLLGSDLVCTLLTISPIRLPELKETMWLTF